MKPLYTPKGKAKEYGDYAVNIYTGCPHRCYYCFAPAVLHRDKETFHANVEPRPGIVDALKKQLEREEITGKLIHHAYGLARLDDGSFVDANGRLYKPPYQPEDILYVRETWQYAYDLDGNEKPIEGTGRYLYAADGGPEPFGFWVNPNGTHRDSMPWRPSIHMPRTAARIFLRVKDVRVEQLQNIDDNGAKAEGANWCNGKHIGFEEKMRRSAVTRFAEIWNSTIKPADLEKYGWDANPWVWVIEYERISKEEAYRHG